MLFELSLDIAVVCTRIEPEPVWNEMMQTSRATRLQFRAASCKLVAPDQVQVQVRIFGSVHMVGIKHPEYPHGGYSDICTEINTIFNLFLA